LSGGVDSACAATLLVKAGFRVEGAFLHLCANSRCCSPESEARARAFAEHLGIPFHRLDAGPAFREKVIERFLREIQLGRTPNPCTFCNEEIKFGFLLDYALEQGFDRLATGHYARLEHDPDEGWRLLRGVDRGKDQSYVLCRIARTSLPNLLFPLGNYHKQEVLARMEGLYPAWGGVRESQDLCFLPPGMPLAHFLAELGLPARPGPIVDREGRVLGEHQGLQAFTIGQRQGIRLAGGPYYVLQLRVEDNALVVGRKMEAYSAHLIAERLNWLSPIPREPFRAEVQIRSGHLAQLATASMGMGDQWEVTFDSPQFALTPGQAVALYQGDWLLAGGVIAS
jgi:tRNA-specific 2-thiouridylase